MRYRVVVTETQSYEVYVEADTQEEAEEIALDDYGCYGDIFHTGVNVVLVEMRADMNKYTCPQCGETFNKLCGPVDVIDLDLECEGSECQYFECPECGYRDEESVFEEEEE